MGCTSTISVKTALRDLLQELPNLDGVGVTIAPPGDAGERERIFFADAEFDHKPAGMRAGRTPRDEALRVDVFVEVWQVGGDSETCETRVVQLGREFEECVADNAGGTGSDVPNGIAVRSITVRGGAVRTRPTDEGFASQIQYRLEADARLT